MPRARGVGFAGWCYGAGVTSGAGYMVHDGAGDGGLVGVGDAEELANGVADGEVGIDGVGEAVVVDTGDAFVTGAEADFGEAGGGGADAQVLFGAQAGEEGLPNLALGGRVAGRRSQASCRVMSTISKAGVAARARAPQCRRKPCVA